MGDNLELILYFLIVVFSIIARIFGKKKVNDKPVPILTDQYQEDKQFTDLHRETVESNIDYETRDNFVSPDNIEKGPIKPIIKRQENIKKNMIKKKKKSEPEIFDTSNTLEINLREGIIYSEILNRKHFTV